MHVEQALKLAPPCPLCRRNVTWKCATKRRLQQKSWQMKIGRSPSLRAPALEAKPPVPAVVRKRVRVLKASVMASMQLGKGKEKVHPQDHHAGVLHQPAPHIACASSARDPKTLCLLRVLSASVIFNATLIQHQVSSKSAWHKLRFGHCSMGSLFYVNDFS